MKALPAHSQATHVDRLGLTLFVAVAVHMLIILGVTFKPFAGKPDHDVYPTMDVTLVNASRGQKPDDPDYLAQISQIGGGNRADKVRATRTPPATLPLHDSPGNAPLNALPQPAAGQRQLEVLTQDGAARAVPAVKEGAATRAQDVTVAQLLRQSEEIASLTAEIEDKMQAQAKRPRERFISASTTAYRDAAYMEAWRAKVERIGNLNYPEEAKRRGLSGDLVLDVALLPDGTVKKITVRRSSGHKTLDDAAVRIVKLAAPFAPFSAAMRNDTDILHITKTWQFLSGNQLHM